MNYHSSKRPQALLTGSGSEVPPRILVGPASWRKGSELFPEYSTLLSTVPNLVNAAASRHPAHRRREIQVVGRLPKTSGPASEILLNIHTYRPWDACGYTSEPWFTSGPIFHPKVHNIRAISIYVLGTGDHYCFFFPFFFSNGSHPNPKYRVKSIHPITYHGNVQDMRANML